jgi:cytoskeletal protein CcmA (bactofilin family)
MMDNLKGADHGAKKTLVEEGTQFKGSLSSSCPIVVKGKIEGDLTAPSLHVSESGAVHGKVKVGEIHSQGELSGEFDADVVQLSGVVKDKTIVRAKSLEVKLMPTNGKMQVVFGECTLDVGDMPSRENAVAAARGEGERPTMIVSPSTPAPAPIPASLPINGANGSPSSPPLPKEAVAAMVADFPSDPSDLKQRASSAPPARR